MAQHYHNYKVSRLTPVARFNFVDLNDDTPRLVSERLKQAGIKSSMEGDLGICSVSVDSSDVAKARRVIEQDSELQKRGVALYDD